MKEEQFIRKLTQRGEGDGNPFRVPEGYFESFNRRLNRRPEMRHKWIADPRLLWRVAASVAVAAGISLTLLLTYTDDRPGDTQGRMVAVASADDEQQYSDDYVYEVMDYAMVGNSEIEDYLTQYE